MTNTGARKFDPTHLPAVDQSLIQEFKSWRQNQEQKPLALEIGPGVGLHPIKFARENPQKALVAIEHTRNKYEKFKRRHQNHAELTNLLPVHANAISWAHHVLSQDALDECLILYPNPAPKASDLAKRWYAMPFMGRLIELIRPGGTLTLATNKAYYEQEASEWLTQFWGLQLLQKNELTQQNWPSHKHRTHFERKYLQRAEICYNLIFKKG